MDSYTLKTLPIADRQVDAIISYLELEFENYDYAKKVYDSIVRCYALIESNPFLFKRSVDSVLYERGFRTAMAMDKYAIVYKIDEVNATVWVHGVFFSTMDYFKLV